MDNNSTARYAISPNALAQRLHGEVVMLDMNTEAYLGLNPTGSDVWDALARGKTVAEIAQHLAYQYDISQEDALRDVTTLIVELEERELIHRLTP